MSEFLGIFLDAPRWVKDGPGWSWDFVKDQNAPGWVKDVSGFPGDFPGGCGSRMSKDQISWWIGRMQDAPGCVQGWPRMALRIVLGIFLDAVWVSSRML